ncbi:MAG: hypothetical protein ABI832_02450 [bacterium]
MKAIAEYFRDLAADDRYFGAEPATPDAAMLHKIAEREIQRRVESKIDGNAVTLRAEDLAPKVSMPAAQPVTPPPVPVLSPAAAQPTGAQPTGAQSTAAEPAIESAAARLSRLRAAQGQILAPLAPAQVRSDISSRFADVEAYGEDQDEDAPAVQTPVAKAPVAEAPAAKAPAAATPPEPQTESSAAVVDKLETIAKAADEPSLETAVQPDAAAAPEADAPVFTDDVLASVRETLAGLIGQDDQLAADMSAAADQPALVATPDDLPEDFATAEVTPEEIEETDHTDLDYMAKLDGEAPAEIAAEAEPEDEQDFQAAAPYADEAVILEPEVEPTAPETAEADAADEPPVVPEKIQRARARVIKIRRLDKKPDVPATVVASPLGDLPAYPAVEPRATLRTTEVTVELTPEAESDLMNELAALEAEIAPDPTLADEPIAAVSERPLSAPREDTAATPLAAVTPSRPTESKLPRVAADDAAVDRLLAQTNSQLEVPETKRRRSAIAHLKAAVLATVADRKNNPDASKKEATVRMDPYRNDLSAVVRPSSTMPPSDRPAPLVLVSAQRIDRKRDAAADAQRPVPQIVAQSSSPAMPTAASQPQNGQSVRPRRVSSGSLAHAMEPDSTPEDEALPPDALDNIFAGGKLSFAEFADSLGVEEVADLIEAAGAYHTLILDQPSFTRPQLFNQMATMPQLAELNREDSLRGFGKLLRDGRIQKSVRGQFMMSETSPLFTEAKKMAS